MRVVPREWDTTHCYRIFWWVMQGQNQMSACFAKRPLTIASLIPLEEAVQQNLNLKVCQHQIKIVPIFLALHVWSVLVQPGLTGSASSVIFESSTAQMDSESRSIINSHVMYSYYPFLKLGSISKLSPQEVNFLEAQGCFRVPSRPILDEFIREYFLHMHPMLPIINEGLFVCIMNLYSSTKSLSMI